MVCFFVNDHAITSLVLWITIQKWKVNTTLIWCKVVAVVFTFYSVKFVLFLEFLTLYFLRFNIWQVWGYLLSYSYSHLSFIFYLFLSLYSLLKARVHFLRCGCIFQSLLLFALFFEFTPVSDFRVVFSFLRLKVSKWRLIIASYLIIVTYMCHLITFF